jgi:type IV secretion system protein VirD4
MRASANPWGGGAGSPGADATPGQGGLEGLLMTLFGVVVAIALWLWAAGEVAGRLWGGRWPRVGATAMAPVLAGLARHLGDPRSAWPPAAASLLPGAVGFYAVLVVIAALVLSPAVAIRNALERTHDESTDARWARQRELGPLVVKGPEPGRLIVGRSGNALLATEKRQSLAVIGPTQTGKTTSFAIPALLEWDGPILAASVKDDLLGTTFAYRKSKGKVWVFDPTRSTRYPSAGWSPLAAIGDWGDAQQVAGWLSGAAEARAGLEEADFWHSSAEKYLAPYLWAAACGRGTMRDVLRWVNTREVAEVDGILQDVGPTEARDEAWANWNLEERQLSSVIATTRIVLKAFSVPKVAAMCDHCEIKPENLLNGKANTLYLCAPPHEQRWLRPLFATLVEQVINAVYKRSVEGEPLESPLLVLLDEAANIAPLRELDTYASTAAGVGMQLVTIWQDVAQMTVRYEDRAHSVLNNHRGIVLLSSISDPATLEYGTRLIGHHEVAHESVTRDMAGVRSTSESTIYRPLAPADALRRIVPLRGILLYGHLRPAQLRLRPYYRERELSARALPGTGEQHEAEPRRWDWPRSRQPQRLDVELDIVAEH